MKSISAEEACERFRLHPRTFSFAKKEKKYGKNEKKQNPVGFSFRTRLGSAH